MLSQFLELLQKPIITEMKNEGYDYVCDKCHTTKLIDSEFQNNWRLWFNPDGSINEFHFCEECWNFIHLKKWTDKGNTHTLRSERRKNVNKLCM